MARISYGEDILWENIFKRWSCLSACSSCVCLSVCLSLSLVRGLLIR
jgi:hypothetical protein